MNFWLWALFQNLVGAAQAFYGLFNIPLKCSILNELETCKGLILNILKGQEHGVRQIDSTIYSNMIWC